jgi:hypothetical protein
MKQKKRQGFGSLTREDLANPHRNVSYAQRLHDAGVTDLRDNHTIMRLPNGKIKCVPIDPDKKFPDPRLDQE